jgi:hypothetical protein
MHYSGTVTRVCHDSPVQIVDRLPRVVIRTHRSQFSIQYWIHVITLLFQERFNIFVIKIDK